jgi:hypothetical protein
MYATGHSYCRATKETVQISALNYYGCLKTRIEFCSFIPIAHNIAKFFALPISEKQAVLCVCMISHPARNSFPRRALL